MTRQYKALFLTLALGLAPLYAAPPAQAGGSVTIHVEPKGKKAYKLQKGLAAIGRIQQRRNNARVDQRGSGNSAYVSQNGSGNTLGVFQRGSGHSATASQDGNNNTLGIFQFGRNTTTNYNQTGNGKTGLIIQGGW